VPNLYHNTTLSGIKVGKRRSLGCLGFLREFSGISPEYHHFFKDTQLLELSAGMTYYVTYINIYILAYILAQCERHLARRYIMSSSDVYCKYSSHILAGGYNRETRIVCVNVPEHWLTHIST
jgi:hypothetical protein